MKCLENKKRSWKCRKGRDKLLPISGLGHDKGFLCHDRAFWFCVVIWFFVLRHGSQAVGSFLVVTGVFLVATELFLLVFYRDRVFPCVMTVFYLCHDNVATESPLSRLRRPRQEIKIATGWVLAGDF